jgi:hypothetical protein
MPPVPFSHTKIFFQKLKFQYMPDMEGIDVILFCVGDEKGHFFLQGQ